MQFTATQRRRASSSDLHMCVNIEAFSICVHPALWLSLSLPENRADGYIYMYARAVCPNKSIYAYKDSRLCGYFIECLSNVMSRGLWELIIVILMCFQANRERHVNGKAELCV